jgi:glycosyltransferase involved in cell wall biosynthesis
MPRLVFAFCTFNRADRLEKLVAAMRAQVCSIPFEILAINNNSTDATVEKLIQLAQMHGPNFRWVTEKEQGIVPARNRAIQESLSSDVLVFIDDDELPLPGLLQAVTHAIFEEGADCVGGPIRIDFAPHERPKWLGRELIGFLGEIDYGPSAFWIESGATPVWSGNVAYRMEVLRTRPDLRFDRRYNREGAGIGGGEDVIMFRAFLSGNHKVRYRPDMAITHFVEPWRLKRGYFLKLHYKAGIRQGQHQLPSYPRAILGVPPFMVSQFIAQCFKFLFLPLKGQSASLRQGMNVANAFGRMLGMHRRWQEARHKLAANP